MARIFRIMQSLSDLRSEEESTVPPAMQVAVYQIPGGDRGTKETLERMKKIVWASIKDKKHGAFLRGLALKITNGCNTKDYRCEAQKIAEWVRDKLRWVKDVRGYETLQYPYRTIEFGGGDCDDLTVVLATLATAIGMPVKLRAIAASPSNKNQFSHVYLMMNPNADGKIWIAADPTVKSAAFGWESPIRYKIMDLNI